MNIFLFFKENNLRRKYCRKFLHNYLLFLKLKSFIVQAAVGWIFCTLTSCNLSSILAKPVFTSAKIELNECPFDSKTSERIYPLSSCQEIQSSSLLAISMVLKLTICKIDGSCGSRSSPTFRAKPNPAAITLLPEISNFNFRIEPDDLTKKFFFQVIGQNNWSEQMDLPNICSHTT